MEFGHVLSFGIYFYISSFCLFLSVCAYILGIPLYLQVLKELPYVEGVLLVPLAPFPLVTRSKFSSSLLYVGGMCPPVIFEPWLLKAYQWMRFILRVTGCKDLP